MSTAATVPNSIKGLSKLAKQKGAIATVTRLTDGRQFTGRLVLEDDNTMVRILSGSRGRPARLHRALISQIVLVETEAAQEMAQELASAS